MRSRPFRCLLPALLLLGGGVSLPRGGPPQETPEGASAVEVRERYGETPDSMVPFGRSAAPYRRFYTSEPLFRGPGRELPGPDGLDSVRIGLMAPIESGRDVRAGTALRRGVELALDEANAAAGDDRPPFELVVKNDRALWGSAANTLVELAYRDGVWAVIGSIDSNSTHVALRAALKAEVVMVNVGSSDPTMTETGIPWIVRVTPDDRQLGYRMARLLFEERGFTRVAVLRSSDRYGRLGVQEFRDAARRLMRPLPMEIQFAPEREDYRAAFRRLASTAPEAVVVWSRAGEAGRIVRQMREQGHAWPVIGTDRLLGPEFLETAGEAAEGAVAIAWMDPAGDRPAWTAFRGAFRQRFGEEPDAFAAYGYDAATMVVTAIRRVGLNRVRIRDALTAVRSYRGVAGEIRLDPTSNNVSPLVLARVSGGRFVWPAREAGEVASAPRPLRIGIVEAAGASADALAEGAEAAVAAVNAEGGVGGRPLRLVRLAAARPWHSAASLLGRAVFERELDALIGPTGAVSSHVAAQLATRGRIPVLSLSPEGGLTRAKVPWVFRGVPDDREQARALLRWALPVPRGRRAAVAVPAGREGREILGDLARACAELGVEITGVARVEARGGGKVAEVPDRFGSADVLLVWLGPELALSFLAERGPARLPARILGSSRLDDPQFLARAPRWIEGLALPLLRTAGRKEVALGHDMVRAYAAAARTAGGSARETRVHLAGGGRFRGRSGTFRFDAWGNRRGHFCVGVLRGGRLSRAIPDPWCEGRTAAERRAGGFARAGG